MNVFQISNVILAAKRGRELLVYNNKIIVCNYKLTYSG